MKLCNDAKMETSPKVGPVGQRVAERVKIYRGTTPVRELSARLEDLGRPILPSGITKIEQGTRRVDVDDLMALAQVLDVTPSQLLFDSFRMTDQIEHHEALGAVTAAVEAAEADGLTIPELIEHLQFLDSQVGRQVRALWPSLRPLTLEQRVERMEAIHLQLAALFGLTPPDPEPVHVDLGLAEQGVPHQHAFPPCGVSLRTELVTADELILGDRAVPVERMVVGPAKDAFAHFHRIDGTSAPHGGQVVLGWGSEDRVVAVDWPFARIASGRVVVEGVDGLEAHYEWETGR